VAVRVPQLRNVVEVTGVALAVEDGLQVVLLRLVIEDGDDLALGVDAGVVVVIELGSGDAVTGEHDRAGDRDLRRCVGDRFRRVEHFRVAVAAQREGREVAIHAVFEQRDRLEEGTAGRRFQPRFGELAGDPLNCDFGAALERAAALQRVGGEEGEIGFEERSLECVVSRLDAGRRLRCEHRGEQEER
jgi:hypothetical protein